MSKPAPDIYFKKIPLPAMPQSGALTAIPNHWALKTTKKYSWLQPPIGITYKGNPTFL